MHSAWGITQLSFIPTHPHTSVVKMLKIYDEDNCFYKINDCLDDEFSLLVKQQSAFNPMSVMLFDDCFGL